MAFAPSNPDSNHDAGINCGNLSDEADAMGIKGGRSVILAALRLIQYIWFQVDGTRGTRLR